MTINQLYDTWFRQVRQLWPTERLPLQRNLSWLLVGIYLSHSVQLHRIAGKIPSHAKLLSTIRRLSRCLQHSPWPVRQWYAPTAQSLLKMASRTTGEIRLIIDATKVSAHHQLVIVALAYQHRALPLIWDWVPYAKGHSPLPKQKKLVEALQKWLPPGVPVLIVGDIGFGSIGMLRLLEAHGWHYALRQKGYTRIQLAGQRIDQRFSLLVTHPGQRAWAEQATLSAKHAYRTNLAGDWQPGEKEPWLLATNLPTLKAALRAYGRRMWIEEMFGDLKKHGFDLEATHLRHVQRLSRLTLLVTLLYLWLIFRGQRAIRHGQRHRAVGSRPDRHPFVGDGRVTRAHGIDRDETTALALELGDGDLHRIGVMVLRRADHDDRGDDRLRRVRREQRLAH